MKEILLEFQKLKLLCFLNQKFILVDKNKNIKMIKIIFERRKKSCDKKSCKYLFFTMS